MLDEVSCSNCAMYRTERRNRNLVWCVVHSKSFPYAESCDYYETPEVLETSEGTITPTENTDDV